MNNERTIANTKKQLVYATASLCLVGNISLSFSRHLDEPIVISQLYTQEVQDPYFGDYEGTYAPSELKPEEGAPQPVRAEAKVYPQGGQNYGVVLRAKPLDVAEWPLQIELNGKLEGGRIRVSGVAGGHKWEGEIANSTLKVAKRGYGGLFVMKQIMKASPTQGLKPPSTAIVLLADEPRQKPSLDEWKEAGWVTTKQGIMHKNLGKESSPDLPHGDLYSKREFRNVRLHVEFRLPYEPELREQSRGNSGIILADCYEVQVLDSYGLVPGAGDCASIYGVAPPRVNAAYPPLSWQTYDITFYAPKIEGGKMIRSPRFTVLWNGIKVHENQTASTPTGDPERPNADSGPLRIQDHGNLVYFRNIWLEELPD